MSEFDRYAPFSPKVEAKPEKTTGDFIAADQANLAENPIPSEPKSQFAKNATEAGAAILGGGAGAAMKYKQGMFGPSPDLKYQTSIPGAGGKPLSQFDLSMTAGQNVEDARRKLQAEIAKWQASSGMRDVEAGKLRGAYERSVVETPEAIAARQAALDRLVSTGGVRAPASPVNVTMSPLAGTGSDVVNRIQSAETSPSKEVSSLARASGQHQYEQQAKYLRDMGVKTVTDLHKMGIVDKGLEEYMASKGMFVPTQEGRVLVRPEVLMNPSQGGASALTPEQIAQRQAAVEAEQATARAKMQAELMRGREFETARAGYGAANTAANAAQRAEKSALDKYLNFMGQRGLESEKAAPNVKLAQDALIQARGQMPSTLSKATTFAQKSAPVLGGALSGAGALESGVSAYHSFNEGDPIRGALESATGAGYLGMMRNPIAGALVGLSGEALQMLYNKYGPEIIPVLEKKGLIPSNWNPQNYSVMTQNR